MIESQVIGVIKTTKKQQKEKNNTRDILFLFRVFYNLLLPIMCFSIWIFISPERKIASSKWKYSLKKIMIILCSKSEKTQHTKVHSSGCMRKDK